MLDLQKILQKVRHLKPISGVVHQVLALANNSECEISDLVKLVEHDPSIVANLLKACNSAFFALPVKVDSIQHAVSMLGLHQVAELVLAQEIAGHVAKAQNGYGLDKGGLWKHSVASAMLARTLAEQRSLLNLSAIYTAALLKDIGKIILHDHVRSLQGEIKSVLQAKNYDFIEAEKECIGLDHATLGAIIAHKWNFSPQMVRMIGNHHLTNSEARNDPAIASVYVADMVGMLSGNCIGIDKLAYHVYEDIFKDFFHAKIDLKALIIIYNGFVDNALRLRLQA